ncbi:MAG: PIG-L family deacetylase [Verrucomicrobia subdivision 3 bacterium]|nr:PIG-L family deacetylase [Limisphaerales bacterium]
MNVVVIAPHPDDEAIGCGGAVCKHVAGGDRVAAVFLTSGELGLKHLDRAVAWKTREAESAAAREILGIRELYFLRQPDWTLGDAVEPASAALASILQSEQPEIIYLPHPGDWHPDHKAANVILTTALTISRATPREIWGYEVWTPLTEYDVVVDITEVIERKLSAIRAHASQLTEIDYAYATKGLNAFRGAVAGRTRYAEVFRLLHGPGNEE